MNKPKQKYKVPTGVLEMTRTSNPRPWRRSCRARSKLGANLVMCLQDNERMKEDSKILYKEERRNINR
jgi:fibrillarin-like rRNA methylase